MAIAAPPSIMPAEARCQGQSDAGIVALSAGMMALKLRTGGSKQ